MEPVLGGRDDAIALARGLGWLHGPQWSPSLADGTTSPWESAPASHAAAPQWSPSLADGTTANYRVLAASVCYAAMEPVLGGRDDAPGGACARSQVAGRNGARPWRTGRRYRG